MCVCSLLTDALWLYKSPYLSSSVVQPIMRMLRWSIRGKWTCCLPLGSYSVWTLHLGIMKNEKCILREGSCQSQLVVDRYKKIQIHRSMHMHTPAELLNLYLFVNILNSTCISIWISEFIYIFMNTHPCVYIFRSPMPSQPTPLHAGPGPACQAEWLRLVRNTLLELGISVPWLFLDCL